MTDIIKTEKSMPQTEDKQMQAITEMIKPFFAMMTDIVTRNTEALEKLAAQQKIQSDRLEALERANRLNTPVTPAQVKYIKQTMRDRARELLSAKGCTGNSGTNKVIRAIRTKLLIQFGVGTVNEIPRCEYNAAIDHIGMWNDRMLIMEVARNERNDMEKA